MVKKKRESAESAVTDCSLTAMRRNAVSLAVTVALSGALALPSAALAQDDDSDQTSTNTDIMDEIITYGTYRQSLLNSMQTKRDNSSIVEAVTAEDLGKLPDVSIAESLARLPGLTVQRLNGRGQVVNIRGTSPDFSTGLLNGREQVSVGDNRGVEFDQYPSELLQQVVVYKTPDAGLVGQGLSGTVDLRTVRPLDYGDRALTLNLRLSESEFDLVDSRDNRGERYSATYIDQFADDTIGIVIGAAHTTTPSYGRHTNAWGYYVDAGAGNVAIGGGRIWSRASELERNSFVFGLDARPTDEFTIEFDAFVSDFTEDQIRHGLVMANLDNLTATESQEFIPGIGIATAGTYATGAPAVENNLFLRDASLQSFGVNFEYDLLNGWVANIDVSHSSIDRDDTDFETTSAPGGAGGLNDSVTFRTGDFGTIWGTGRDYTNLDYNTADAIYATSPFGWGDPSALAPFQPAGQFGYNKVFTVNDDINAFRAELERELDWNGLTGVEFGYNLTNRVKDRVSDEGVITAGQIDSVTGELLTAVELPAGMTSVADLSWGMTGANTSIVSFDPRAMLAGGVIQQGDYLYNDILTKGWDVEEDVHTAYMRVDFDSVIGDMPLSGNFGFAYQWWDQESSGVTASGAGASLYSESLSGSSDGSEILPSLNVTLDISENQKLRFGAARQLARPRMDEMKESTTFSYDENLAANTQADIDAEIANGQLTEIQVYDLLSPWSRGGGANGGNINLDPWVADSFDLSYEFYFPDGRGYISAAVFHKDLKTYIYNDTSIFDFTGLPTSSSISTDIVLGVSTTPENGEGGTLEGWELALNLDFGLFMDALDGVGIVGTFSHNDSNIEPEGPGSGGRLPGLSEDVWNLTAYFERGGFSARIAQRYRDGYVGEVAGFGGARTGSDIEDEEVLDAQIGYEFVEGPLEGLNIVFQAQNLTDEPLRTLHAAQGLPNEYQTFGTTYQLGFSYAIY